MVNRALCIGFAYNGTQYPLNGPLNDARNMTNLFKKLGFVADLYTDQTNYSNAYKSNLVKRLNGFMNNLNNNDTGVITISSHGSLIYDTDMDEIKGVDGRSYDQGVVCRARDGNPKNYELLVDDELHKLINDRLQNKKNVKLLFIIDSCYSGSMCDLQYQLNESQYVNIGSKMIGGANQVALISGSTEHQYSYETIINGNIQGVLTNSIIACIGAMSLTNRSINIRNLYDVLIKNKYFTSLQFPQNPVLSSNVMQDFVFSFKISATQNTVRTNTIRFTGRTKISNYIC